MIRGGRAQDDFKPEEIDGRRRKYVPHVSAPYNGWANENGQQCHYKNGWLDKSDGPALIDFYYEAHYSEGLLHRENGPAKIYRDGREEWYLKGRRWMEAEILAAGGVMTKQAIKPLKTIKLKNRPAFQRLP